MVGQSIAIVAVILVMAFMFLRSGKRAGAWFALPLISVPVFHLLGYAVHKAFVESSLPTTSLHISIDIAGLIVGVLFCWKLSGAISLKLVRYVYFFCCVIFLAALTVVYILYHA